MERTTWSIIEAFASALDKDDYDAAGDLLDPHCVYEFGGQKLESRAAVLKSFRDNSEWAHSNLRKVIYIHSIENCHDSAGTIRFIDCIEHAGLHARYECLMHVILAGDGAIKELRLEDLPGEKDKVSSFLASVGISR